MIIFNFIYFGIFHFLLFQFPLANFSWLLWLFYCYLLITWWIIHTFWELVKNLANSVHVDGKKDHYSIFFVLVSFLSFVSVCMWNFSWLLWFLCCYLLITWWITHIFGLCFGSTESIRAVNVLIFYASKLTFR